MIQLDHLVLPVESLDSAAQTLSDSGFVVTPQAEHPFGTANRLVVFDGAYLELVTVVDAGRLPPTGFARRVFEHLDSGSTGFSHVACAARSVTAAGDAARELGLDAEEPMWFSRRAPRSDGSELTASFTLLALTEAPQVFFCIHHTPTAVWFGPHLAHPNGARTIARAATRLDLPFTVDPIVAGPPRIQTDQLVDAIEVGGVVFGAEGVSSSGGPAAP